MIYDYIASIRHNIDVDRKIQFEKYMKKVEDVGVRLPNDMESFLVHQELSALRRNWIHISIEFTLRKPFFSKDDQVLWFYDNPINKDRVFKVPIVSATTWKGLLRWACRMQAGLFEHLEQNYMKLSGWKDESWIVHLFGNEKDEKEIFQSGALSFYPTWFQRIGFEVINPHSRTKKAGTQPIFYEVVPSGTQGCLNLLYSPIPGAVNRDSIDTDILLKLLKSTHALFHNYGISSKRTAGWGAAETGKSIMSMFPGNHIYKKLQNAGETMELPWLDYYSSLMDADGFPVEQLRDGNGMPKSKTQYKNQDYKPCSSKEYQRFAEWYNVNGESYRDKLAGKTSPEVTQGLIERSSLQELIADLEDCIENRNEVE